MKPATADENTAGIPVETEAKLWASQGVFRALWDAPEVAGWPAVERRAVRLRDTYWDTPDRRLATAGYTLRVRELDGASPAELTLKGPVASAGADGASRSRTEHTVAAPAGSGPHEWARLPAARALLAGLAARPEHLRPDIVLLNPRREVVLRRGHDEAVLSLDEVRLDGQPYLRRYVEIESKRGSRDALDQLVRAVAAQFRLRPARAGKVQAARAWLAKRPVGHPGATPNAAPAASDARRQTG